MDGRMGCTTLEDKNSGGQVIHKAHFWKDPLSGPLLKDPLLEERLPTGLS
jgi:hypothetical protein